jgi:hypothetical protein
MNDIQESDAIENGVWDIHEIEEKVIKPNQWGSVGPKTFKAFSVTHAILPSGCYSITMDRTDGRSILIGKYIKSDKIMRFKDGLSDRMLKEINDFWKKEQSFKDYGFLHRRGYLLYGPQGVGKSSIIWQVSNDVIKRGGVVFVCDNPKFFSEGLQVFRQVEPNRPIVCVFEDVDAIIKKYGESEILALLDGDNQINRVINLASTNYPENLDQRIVNRPRRFDRVFKVVAPDEGIRSAFLKEKLPKSEKIKDWLKKTEGLSFASLTEAIISVFCLGNTLDNTIKILKELENSNPQSSDFGAKVGFDDDDDEPARGRRASPSTQNPPDDIDDDL